MPDYEKLYHLLFCRMSEVTDLLVKGALGERGELSVVLGKAAFCLQEAQREAEELYMEED